MRRRSQGDRLQGSSPVQTHVLLLFRSVSTTHYAASLRLAVRPSDYQNNAGATLNGPRFVFEAGPLFFISSRRFAPKTFEQWELAKTGNKKWADNGRAGNSLCLLARFGTFNKLLIPSR